MINILSKLINTINYIYLFSKFVFNKLGKEYSISRSQKLQLAKKIMTNRGKVNALSDPIQHLVLIEEILRVPKSIKGDIVECGCYDGASTISLSLACKLVKRRLFVCDSFEGLPQPKENEKYDIFPETKEYYEYKEGEFSSTGGLDGVKANVSKFGNIEVCRFVKGYFADTLKNIETESIVLVFEDADIVSSVMDCLIHLYPKLQDGCKFYSHEPWSVGIVSLFYDTKWWQDNFRTPPPGFNGSGVGIKAGLSYINMGYAQKVNVEKIKDNGKRIVHLGSKA
jgi:O-methyltransferase